MHVGGVVTAVVPRAALPDQDAAHSAFEIGWKFIWLAVIGVPLLIAGDIDSATLSVLFACLWVVIVVAVVP